MTTAQTSAGQDAIRVLGECRLFQFCPPEDIAKFAECTRIRRYAPGELICARGTTGSEFYIVMEGAVDIAVPKISEASVEGAGAGASEVRVRQVPAGGFFGEIACLEENGTRTGAKVRLSPDGGDTPARRHGVGAPPGQYRAA
jgi:CRP-like cAMP-binding protein